MNKITLAAAVAVALTVVGGNAQAQATADQAVTYTVQAVNAISATGTIDLVINASTVSGPTSVTANGSYAVSTNEVGASITAALDSDMPAGVALLVNLDAPAGATSNGFTTLSATAVPVVSAISTLSDPSEIAAYKLTATAAAGVVSGSRTVTFTITAGA